MVDRPQGQEGGETAREPIGDEEIAGGVRRALLMRIHFQTHPIEVSVEDGVVTLRGAVDSASQRQEAAQLAVMAAGVRDVVNLIAVPGDWA